MLTRVKNWFKKSGIKYVVIPSRHPNYHLQGTEMIDSLNPLDRVIEHPEYPMARIYREGFWTGVADTFHVLMGNHYDMYVTGGGEKEYWIY